MGRSVWKWWELNWDIKYFSSNRNITRLFSPLSLFHSWLIFCPSKKLLWQFIFAMLHSASSGSFPKTPVNLFFSVAAVCLFQFVSSEKLCYYPDGTTAYDELPCHPSAEVSVCCARGWTCLSNSVCILLQDSQLLEEFSYSWIGATIQSTCTDKSWVSSECSQYCTGVYHFHWLSALESDALWQYLPTIWDFDQF